MSEVATVGKLKSSSSKYLTTLSDAELEEKASKRLRIGNPLHILGFVPMVGSLPVAALWSNSSFGSLGPILALSMVGVGAVSTFVGLVIGDKSKKYSKALKARKTEEERALLREWQLATVAELKERFSIDFEIFDLEGLKYPREDPTTKATVRYGTIEKLIENSEGEGARLEQLTLIWSNGEPRILRAVTELRDINGGMLK